VTGATSINRDIASHRLRRLLRGLPAPARSLLWWSMLALLLALLLGWFHTLVALFDRALHPHALDSAGLAGADPAWHYDATLAARRLANALPLLALAMVVLGLARRPLLSLWLTSLAAGVLYLVDRLKFDHQHSHLLPADVLLLPQLLAAPELVAHYVQDAGFGIGSALVLAGITVAVCLEPAQRWLRGSMRMALVVAGAGLALAIASGSVGTGRWYDDRTLGFVPWTPTESSQRAGLVATLVKLGAEAPWRLPPADPVYVAHILATHEDRRADTTVDVARPDIVLWQSESLFAPGRLNGLRTGDHLPALTALRARSNWGDLQVPAYGGGTARTEFEALTGYPLYAFAGINHPYSALAQKPLLALPRHLRSIGYRTVAIHPYQRGFWSRDTALPHLGFDEFLDDGRFDEGDRHGWYIGDHALLRQVAAVLGEADAGDPEPPLFVFAISMENHGPWHERPGIDQAAAEAIAVPDNLPPGPAGRLRHYLYHARRADRTLADLVDLLERRQRHTVLVFYGDHLPGLDQVHALLGFRDGREPWRQPVPYLVYDNRGGAVGASAAELRSYHLPSLVLDAAGIRADGHWQVLGADRERHGRTALARIAPDPLLDYDHALSHLAWHYWRQTPPDALAAADDPAD
jgi:hypothetical protein